jgi:hypothetical protein
MLYKWLRSKIGPFPQPDIMYRIINGTDKTRPTATALCLYMVVTGIY